MCSAKRFSGEGADTYACSQKIRPQAGVACEHMFCSTRTSTLAQRALGALRLTRSFLLLEDDHDVDWEVDRDEHLRASHPHRAPLRGRPARRRAGQPAPAAQLCLCPVGGERERRLLLTSARGGGCGVCSGAAHDD